MRIVLGFVLLPLAAWASGETALFRSKSQCGAKETYFAVEDRLSEPKQELVRQLLDFALTEEAITLPQGHVHAFASNEGTAGFSETMEGRAARGRLRVLEPPGRLEAKVQAVAEARRQLRFLREEFARRSSARERDEVRLRKAIVQYTKTSEALVGYLTDAFALRVIREGTGCR